MNLHDVVMSTLSDIRCLAELGSKGVHELDIERQKYDVLFDTINSKACRLEDELDYIKADITEKEKRNG